MVEKSNIPRLISLFQSTKQKSASNSSTTSHHNDVIKEGNTERLTNLFQQLNKRKGVGQGRQTPQGRVQTPQGRVQTQQGRVQTQQVRVQNKGQPSTTSQTETKSPTKRPCQPYLAPTKAPEQRPTKYYLAETEATKRPCPPKRQSP